MYLQQLLGFSLGFSLGLRFWRAAVYLQQLVGFSLGFILGFILGFGLGQKLFGSGLCRSSISLGCKV